MKDPHPAGGCCHGALSGELMAGGGEGLHREVGRAGCRESHLRGLHGEPGGKSAVHCRWPEAKTYVYILNRKASMFGD